MRVCELRDPPLSKKLSGRVDFSPRDWIILSFNIGSTPCSSELELSEELRSDESEGISFFFFEVILDGVVLFFISGEDMKFLALLE